MTRRGSAWTTTAKGVSSRRRFYLFWGIPSSGKTVLLNNIADNICLNGYPVLFFSYDDGRAELRHRTFSRFSKQPIEEFNNRTLRDIGNICQIPTIKQIMPLKYIVQQMIPVEKWSDLIDQIKQKHGKAPVIIIDYLRKLWTEKSIGDERLRVDDILSKLTEIAKVHNTPVIAISELARDSYKSGQRLSMASFKESGTIEYEASWLGILAAVEEKNGEYIVKENWDTIIEQDGNVDLIIFKAKRGTGATGRIPLKVNKNIMTVSDRHLMERLCKRAKVKPFGFHGIRHLTASILYQKGYTPSVIQTILRHVSPNTTARYIHSLGLEETREALEEGLKGPAQVIEFKKVNVV